MDMQTKSSNPLEMARNVHDLGSIDKLRQAAKSGDKGALEEAAKQFEGIFVQMMLKSMRQAQDVLSDKDSPFNSQQVTFYRDMHDKQLATELATNSSLGLADIIVQQFGGSESFMPADALRNDGNLAALQADPTLRINTQVPLNTKAVNVDLVSAVALPVSKQSGFTSPKDFVMTLYPLAQRAAEALNIDPKALVAQAAVETGWGQYVMHQGETSAHNLFGIKADSRWGGDAVNVSTLEYRDGTAHKEQAQFRRYDSYSESMHDYVDFIHSNPRYSEALTQTHDAQQYFTALQQAGYATDPNYANKVIKVMDSEVFNASMSAVIGVAGTVADSVDSADSKPLNPVSARQVGE